MLLSIKEIPEGHSVHDQEVTMTEEQVQEGGFMGAVFCHADIERLHSQMFIRVHYSCRVHQECARCLTVFEYPLTGLCTVVLQDKNARDGLGQDEVDYLFSDRDTVIDIRQSIYEDVIINIPIKPLCREDCAGVTEVNLGRSKEENTIDPRWEALKKLKNSTQSNT